ncbi:MAG: phosphate acyltransferase PlsX [Clostridia bacterium]|nr:phosphate acyltransferase PlsX [Clostridia bacterium]
MKKVLIDIGSCDFPQKMIRGALEAATAFPAYGITVVGDGKLIDETAGEKRPSNFFVVDAPEVITNDDVPSRAIRQKPDSSLVKSIYMLKDSDEYIGLISGGSTGAVLMGSTLILRRIKGVSRPVLASFMPTAVEGKLVCIADSGANVDSKPEFMAQFAVMADIYVRSLLGIEKPVVGLLSVGTEDHKGDERTRAVHALLKSMPLEFAGNMEARDALSGDYDIIVTDGFAGNVLIKSVEGTAKMVMGELKKALFSSTKAKIGALLMKKQLGKMKKRMDYHSYGGAAFLGVNKLVMKTHGSSNEVSTKASVSNLIKIYEQDIIKKIADGMADGGEDNAD